ncbi:MAG: hypothetical protein M1150_02455 [Patescibacteria group bacterium]|nr:hypothetical protein [Patescibacteria group bacterium]
MTTLSELVDSLVGSFPDEVVSPISKIVGHGFPDDDVWGSAWLIIRRVPKAAAAKVVFVRAGESLPDSDGDPSVIHVDTGGGEYDQHGKNLAGSSSMALLAEKLGLLADPGIKPILEMVSDVDNVRPLVLTSLHYLIEGYPRTLKKSDGTIDWEAVQARVFEAFDILYTQERARADSRRRFASLNCIETLLNGVKLARLFGCPELREAAFEKGIHVALWTQPRGKGFWVGIQTNRLYPGLCLDSVIVSLRFAEARVRGVDVRGKNLSYIGNGEVIPGWFFHDSKRLVLCGSRTHPLTKEEMTRLTPATILEIVKRRLVALET